MENIHDMGKGSISSSFPPPVFSAFPSFTSSKCHQEPKSFIIYRLTSQSPAGEVWGWEMGREREQINDKRVYIMPQPATCNINGQEGNITCMFVCECLCEHVDQKFFAVPGLGILQLSHSLLLRRCRPSPKTQHQLQQR